MSERTIEDVNQRTGAELGTQIWVSGKPFDPAMFKPVIANERPWMKPRRCGFWTAQWDEQHGGGWVQWCLGEDFDVSPDRSWQVTLLRPEPNARVLVIDSYEDLELAYERWPQPYDDGMDGGHLAWHLIAENFDAVHLTEKGQWATRLSMPLDLYGWDCESTLWFRPAFADVKGIGRRVFEREPWSDDE